jgi:hypothetical protein
VNEPLGTFGSSQDNPASDCSKIQEYYFKHIIDYILVRDQDIIGFKIDVMIYHRKSIVILSMLLCLYFMVNPC